MRLCALAYLHSPSVLVTNLVVLGTEIPFPSVVAPWVEPTSFIHEKAQKSFQTVDPSICDSTCKTSISVAYRRTLCWADYLDVDWNDVANLWEMTTKGLSPRMMRGDSSRHLTVIVNSTRNIEEIRSLRGSGVTFTSSQGTSKLALAPTFLDVGQRQLRVCRA